MPWNSQLHIALEALFCEGLGKRLDAERSRNDVGAVLDDFEFGNRDDSLGATMDREHENANHIASREHEICLLNGVYRHHKIVGIAFAVP